MQSGGGWNRALPYLFGVATGVIVGLGALVFLLATGRIHGDAARPKTSAAAAPVLDSRRNAIVRAVERTRRSVVTIRSVGPDGTALEKLLLFPFDVRYQWVGSGFLVDARGYVLTNDHVVRGASEVVVSAGDSQRGISVPATLVGTAPEFDLALLRIPEAAGLVGGELGGIDTLLVAAELGDSDDLLVGEWAIAIGSPYGRELGGAEPSVSVGVISAVQRDLPFARTGAPWPYLRMIQTDAAINEGNSGGPLVNANGEVIGVNTVKLVGSVGVNFSIPVNTVRWVWQELREYGEVRRPWIGWAVEEISSEVRRRLQIPEEEGILTVVRVVPGSPADDAGIQAGDIIRSLRGLDAYSLSRAERILFGTRVGSSIEVELLRDGQLHRILVHIAEDPSAQAARRARRRSG